MTRPFRPLKQATKRKRVRVTKAQHEARLMSLPILDRLDRITGINEPGCYTIIAPVHLQSEANLRGAWQPHHRRHQHHRIAGKLYMSHCLLPKDAITAVTITRIAPRMLDSDNATGSAKSLRDGIADWIGRGDGPKCGIVWDVKQEKGAEYATKIEVRT